jgi:hypothetical protein
MIQLEQEINRIKVISCIFFQIYQIMNSFLEDGFVKMPPNGQVYAQLIGMAVA